MLLINCPVCGLVGEEGDFHAGGQAHIERPATSNPEGISDDQQRDYLFMRLNPKGVHFERWRCDRGCGKWFHAARDTMTCEFKGYYGITELPPAELIKIASPQWQAFFKTMKAGAKKSTGKVAAKKTARKTAAKKAAKGAES